MTPSKNLRHQVSSELCWLAILYMCCPTPLLGELSAVMTPRGEDNSKLMACVPCFFFFFFLILFDLYPFAVINYDLEYNNFS